MTSLPSVEDLRLVDAIARHGSVGGAARELLVSQPAASQRLAALERRVGAALFDRDTTGARPTRAGAAMAHEARHVLDHLGSVFERARSAASADHWAIGTFPSLAPALFPALEQVTDRGIHQVVDHGDLLISLVAEGSLDAAVVAIADQLRLPGGTIPVPLGRETLSVLVPSRVQLPERARRPYQGVTVVVHTYDLSGDRLHRRMADLGAIPRGAGTAETAVQMARASGSVALLPTGLARHYLRRGEQLRPSPVARSLRLSLVTRTPTAPALRRMASDLAPHLHLT